MSEFQVEPIGESLARRVRESLLDPIYGLPVRVEPATGYGPCRLCLHTFAKGERRILFLYNPFSIAQDADFAGPVFIHADACRPYGEVRVFPEEVARLPIVLHAYDRHQRRVARVVPDRGAVFGCVESLFESDDTAVVHVRNAEAKCFIVRVVRARADVDQSSVPVVPG